MIISQSENFLLCLEIMQGVDIRDSATQQVSAIRHRNYSQFLRGTDGLYGVRLGVMREGPCDNIQL